jgi:DNA polymerase III gamma/tau subunit
MELYKKYRPTKFKDVVGQQDAIRPLVAMGKQGNIPHCLLFTGPSGTGKTTIARILKSALKCSDSDFVEINGSEQRGIDAIREIKSRVNLAPLGGKCRVWLIDECFPGSSLVHLSDGNRMRIDSLVSGMSVLGVDGEARISKVFRNLVPLDRLVCVKFSDGTSQVTTRDHLYLTADGWQEAVNLNGSYVYSHERVDCEESKSLSMVWEGIRAGKAREMLLPIVRTTDGASDYVVAGVAEKIEMGLELRNCRSDQIHRTGFSDKLQIGHSLREHQSRNRGRWERASVEEAYLARCKENKEVELIRVVGVESYQSEGNGELFSGCVGDIEKDRGYVEFFDLEIDGHPSYCVGGKMVHNCHALTADAQNSFLKLLEDTPQHVYFMLATTDPGKLKKTIHTRSTEVRCKEISPSDLIGLVNEVCKKEEFDCPESVVKAIVDAADGSARKALVILNVLVGLGDDATEEQMIASIQSNDTRGQAIAIARALMKGNIGWEEMRKILSEIDEPAESIRRLVLSYCRSVLLRSANKRAAFIMEEFRDNFYDTDQAGLTLACWNVVKG